MNFHSAHARPCPWMRIAIARLADDNLHGFWGWLAREHLKRCSVCRKAYETLRALRERLFGTVPTEEEPRLDESRWSMIERRLEEETPPNRAGPLE
ncbi:MAG: hypothetical protein M9921_02205 [Fimbriimonadaceae bacterium]|nr:hypothetical protein [Chthonomonadaceae bacterium]MCO5295648.1 hypothetical protein [Fimbriimonadaceae bacterium]